MKNENRFKLNMNKETKRAVVVLSIIALLILIIGLVSCSVQLSNSEPLLPPSGQGADTPIPTQSGGVVVDIDKGGEDMPPQDKTEDTGKDTADDKPTTEKPITKPTPPTVKPISPVKPVTPPAVPVKPTEPTKPTQPVTPPVKPEKPAEKPSRPDGGGSGSSSDDGSDGGDSSVSYPAAVVEITAPTYSHTDTEFEVKSTRRNVKSISWTVSENGKNTPQTEFLKGTLANNGGKITITKEGDYTITATAKNYGGNTYTFSKTIHIYPTCDITVTADKNIHTDKAFTVKATISDNVMGQIEWHIFKDGKEAKWKDTVTGTLNNSGGSIQIKEHGSYTLKAIVHDKTNRAFFGKADVMVSPIVEISLQAPAVAHTDTMVSVSASTKELGNLNIVWSMTKDGKTATISGCTEGKLTNEGGMVRFKEKGNYTLTATVTDKAGRVFSEKASIKIYPVAAFSFELPPTTHTDKTVKVVVKSAELQDMTAEWTVIYNSKVVKPTAVIDGVLTNEGGSIRFTKKGTYTLKATMFDKIGREYSHEAVIVSYPIAETGFYLPPMAHTDTIMEVKTTFKDTENLTAVWSLTKDGKAISLTDGVVGTLTDNGGKIRFKEAGKYELKATVTDSTGRRFTYSAPITIHPFITITLDLPKETHTDRPIKATAKVTNGDTIPVRWKIIKDGIDEGVPDGVFAKNDGNMYFTIKGFYSVTVTVTDSTGRAFSATKDIRVYPIPKMTFTLPAAIHTDDILPVDTTLTDMENLTAVWYVDNTFGFQDWYTYIDGTLRNNGGSIRFKSAGVYSLQARVTDATGRVFRFNSGKVKVLPMLSRPVITRTPNSNSIAPGTPVTITASSTDIDGDGITYIGEGRPSQTATYPLGKNTVRVKAVDSTGAESPWAAITFFVMDSDGNSGMMLTGPDSTIIENGIEGATITRYTFTVPPFASHNGNDYGRVRGYNVKIGAWEQLDYGTTTNGITFTKTLTAGTYSKLEMYYYTNHACMYNRANITYTVDYYFE